MFLSILSRMIFWELTKVFLLSLLALTGIMLMAGVIAEASQQGLGPAQIIAIVPLIIPSLLPYTIPATTLFATCLVYGRLAADSEIVAIKSAGVNVLRVVWPGVLLGLVVSLGTMGLYYRIIPYTHHLLRQMFLHDVQEVLHGILRKERSINHPGLNFAVFVERVQGRKLINATFKRRGKNGQFDLIIHAAEAELEVDINRDKPLLLVHMRGAQVVGPEGFGIFPERLVEVELPELLGSMMRPPRPRDMTWTQLHEGRASWETRLRLIGDELTAAREGRLTNHAPENLPTHMANLEAERRMADGEIRQIDTEFQMRPALALGCVCFVLIGCPVGIWLSRNDYLSAFVTCFLPIVFLYYPVLLCGTNLAKDGRLSPVLSVWAADVLIVLLALPLYWRLLKN